MSVFGFETVHSHWEGLGWKQRRIYQNHLGSISKTHLTPLPLESRPVQKEGQYNLSLPRQRIKSKGSIPPIRKMLHAFVQVTGLKVQMQECFQFACPKSALQFSNLDCWDISSPASLSHNDILLLLIQPHPYALKILILPRCIYTFQIFVAH